ncbi:MAG: hypothetical protein J0H83_06255 [Candidatus Melainabacteria bacterium]|jgi:hypothetical protein|nr:hypothetical protein [Candidatus Melainabacteria bacterium]MBX9674084.1 hypothetical protein [Candidatus Obscuribacterales bacterium]
MPNTNTIDASQERFPLSDAAYDLINIIAHKSKALKAYEEYASDLRADTHLTQILIEIKHDEIRHIEKLKAHLGRLLVDVKEA